MMRLLPKGLFPLMMFLLLAGSSCESRKFKNEYQQLDSLDAILKSSDKAFNLDEKVIRERRDYLETELRYIQLNANDTFSAELSNALGELRVIKKVYAAYLESHAAIEKEAAELKVQVETLRYSLKKEEITLDQFIQYYEKEKQDILRNRQDVENIHERVFSVEPLYNRLVPLMEAEVKRLKTLKGENPRP